MNVAICAANVLADAPSAKRIAGMRNRSTGTSGAVCCDERRTSTMPVTAPSATMPMACNGKVDT